MLAPSDLPPLRVGTREQVADAVTRSHLPDGRVVGWYGEAAVVIDAEPADAVPPPSLAARFGAADFWRRWTAAECAAKAAGVPMQVWLGRHGLTHPGVIVEHHELTGLSICVARRSPTSL